MADAAVLETVYNPRAVEPEIYTAWEAAGAFRSTPANTPRDRTYAIVIPPPNVTGALHLGHALNNTLQDILIRYHRMRGFNTLWQPGTDHAGIATQAVVERRIRESEGKSRHDLGREELVRRIWQWKDDYEQRILSQLKLMGCSCDWARNRFTLDEGLARAVHTQFFNMFRDGLIFRGKRLVNWDTELQTAVANDEVYHETVKGKFWEFKYPVVDPKPGEPVHVIIATTRPETMLGDTAVAVCADPEGALDTRERDLQKLLKTAPSKERTEIGRKLEQIAERRATRLDLLKTLAAMASDGRKVLLPLVDREIPLIADEHADPLLGSGCVKITPAHDPNDYEVGLRHDLPMINVMTADGRIARIIESDGSVNANNTRYEGLVFSKEGRERVVADLEAKGLLGDVVDRDREVGHSDRSKTPIEPYLSDQWFVQTSDVNESDVKSNDVSGVRLGDGSTAPGLAQAAIDVVQDGKVQIFPERYAKSYLDWLAEKRDWCISRQLWWGHRVPVWSAPIGQAQSNANAADRLGIADRLEGRYHVSPDKPSLREHAASEPSGLDGSSSLIYVCAAQEPSDHDRAELIRCGFQEDEDVLDTWFSSALWPFSTLGWPDDTPHLKQYYPGSVLITSRDIITNWVARMVMFGLYAIGEVPFDHVYIHPKILDGRGETMSKSKGNGVDPVDVIHTHGADALRYAMADMTTETQDIRMPVEYVCPHCDRLVDQGVVLKAEEQRRKSRGEKLDRRLQPADCRRAKCTHKDCGREFATQWADQDVKKELGVARETSDKFDIGRNFCNKLWNAARFAFLNLEGAPCRPLDIATLPPEDRWVLARLSETVRRYHQLVVSYQFSASLKELREFFWDVLCDWYIELTKPRMSGERGEETRAVAQQVLAFCMDQSLRLFHPTLPFITERLWRQLNTVAPQRGLPGVADPDTDGQLVLAMFPPVEGYPDLDDATILTTFAELQDATRGVRELRTTCEVSPKQRVDVTVVLPEEHQAAFQSHAHIVQHMAGVANLHVSANAKRPRNAGSIAVRGLRIFVHDISDDTVELARVTKALVALEKQIGGKEAKLSNQKFVANAKPEVVQAERDRLAALQEERAAMQAHLAELNG